VRIPDVGQCSVDSEACTTSSGCDGLKICVNGVFGQCLCADTVGIQVSSCPSCGTTGKAVCDGACHKTGCSVTVPVPCTAAQNGCTVPGTGVCVNGNITSCTGCSGTASCPTSCNNGAGTATCNSTCGLGTCVPPAETCDGRDNDCNGLVDDGIVCGACDAL
jgi:hypothetical protein